MTPVGMLPRLKQFTIAGIFAAGHFEYDSSLVLIHIADAQKLYRMKGDQVSGVRLKLVSVSFIRFVLLSTDNYLHISKC